MDHCQRRLEHNRARRARRNKRRLDATSLPPAVPRTPEETDSEVATLGELPAELKHAILEHVDTPSLPVLRHVSCEWRALVERRLQLVQGRQAHRRHNTENDRKYANYLAKKGYCAVLRWAVEQCGLSIPYTSTHERAARAGHLGTVQWLFQHKEPPFVTWVYEAAAEGGHFAIINWLCAQGHEWDWRTCAGAARGGHLQLLRWARKKGCPWSGHTYIEAVTHGHSKLACWARDAGCPQDVDLDFAARQDGWTTTTFRVGPGGSIEPSTLIWLTCRPNNNDYNNNVESLNNSAHLTSVSAVPSKSDSRRTRRDAYKYLGGATPYVHARTRRPHGHRA